GAQSCGAGPQFEHTGNLRMEVAGRLALVVGRSLEAATRRDDSATRGPRIGPAGTGPAARGPTGTVAGRRNRRNRGAVRRKMTHAAVRPQAPETSSTTAVPAG